ncbi:hypothetical protein C0993_009848, partial [Termitomyces sp. T159_Od127]
MPSHRAADAAPIAPYLTHAVSHHGQITLVPADNNGRVRQAKGNRSRPRQERNTRTEEELRFNVGPRTLRNFVGNRTARRSGRQDRGLGESNEPYPDYPPPSFLEATSVPASLDNATFVALSQPASPIAPTESTSTFPVTSPSQVYISPTSMALSSGNEVDSDTSSIEIVDTDSLPVEGQLPSGHKLEENIRRDWLNRRGVEFPSPPENQARSRSKVRSRAILDSDSEDGTEEIPYALRQTSPKNKHLSSLRTLFPYRAMTVDQPLSASPNSSPYSSRSSLSFLSATSLKMSVSTTSISSVQGESFFSRKFLSFKGKDHAKEPLETWEVVEKQPDSNVGPDNASSPTRSQSFTYGMPTPTQVVKAQAPLVSPTPPVTTSATAPHPLSLRDRKPPPVPFVTRPKKKVPQAPPKPAPLVSVPQGPILVSVRTRIPPPLPRKPLHLTSSPLVQDSWFPTSLEVDTESNAVLQQAIGTPLPVSPIEGGSPTTSVLPSPADSMILPASAPSPTSPTVLDHQSPARTPEDLALPALGSSQPSQLSEITDLDVLVTQISEEEHRDGLDYDALLLLSEFIGPASPHQRSTHSAPPGTTPRDAQLTTGSKHTNVPLLGNVRLERRRTTKDGRVKLKLALLDAAVDKCGICLTQFRNGDAAQIGS